MAVVYGVLCHHSPLHVADLVRHLHHPGHQVILHADAAGPAALHAMLAHLGATFPNVHVLESTMCAWGGWSLVAASLRAIRRALALPMPWRHFALLSEQHMPLQPPSVIAASLPDGASFIAATRLTGMDSATRADLLHRFARQYRELPGVGMFAGEVRRLDAETVETLRLGSQWVVLSRAACERLADLGEGAAAWAPFRNSLVADETAIHSVLRGTAVGRGLDIRSSNQSFVAWPHLGGDVEGGFTEAGARLARARGHLFIRKRPRVLPPFARQVLAGMPQRPAFPPLPPVSEAPEPATAALGTALAAMLRARFPALVVRVAPPGSRPACFLQFQLAGLPSALAVCLASQDLRAFKVLLAWRRPFDGSLTPIRLAGYTATVMGVRLPGLLLAREVHVPELPDHGFVTVADGEVWELAARLTVALAVARRLTVLTGAEAA